MKRTTTDRSTSNVDIPTCPVCNMPLVYQMESVGRFGIRQTWACRCPRNHVFGHGRNREDATQAALNDYFSRDNE